jgi:RNA polymerase sigma-70 factor (ECF subfamily)
MDETQILQGCLQRNVTAQEALYNHFCPRMMGVCYRYAGNREDAEDMLQEGFMKVFAYIHQYRQEGSLEGWIRRIMVHTCINFLKKEKKLSELADIIHAHKIIAEEATGPSIMNAKKIIECIRLLPVGYRTVLNLYAIEGYSHREISQILDITESTSRSQYSRARLLLENILIRNGILDKKDTQSDIRTAMIQ